MTWASTQASKSWGDNGSGRVPLRAAVASSGSARGGTRPEPIVTWPFQGQAEVASFPGLPVAWLGDAQRWHDRPQVAPKIWTLLGLAPVVLAPGLPLGVQLGYRHLAAEAGAAGPVVMPNYPGRSPPPPATSRRHRHNRDIGIIVVIPISG